MSNTCSCPEGFHYVDCPNAPKRASLIPPHMTRVDLPNGRVIEAPEFDVTLTIVLRTPVRFSEMERATMITPHDAIDNAWGCIDNAIVEQISDGFGGEFDVTITETVHRTSP